ncbi:hypothetical protein KKC45_01160, partial [Patescibacteria group bacterium]|nr:hypothetical protein [Patescibacteria group bacterium]
MDKSQQKLNILNQIMEESQDENNLSSEGWLTIENMHLDVEGKILSETIIDLDNKEILKIIMYGGYPYEVDEEVAYTREGNLIQDKDNIYIDYVVLDNQKLKEELGNLNDWFLIKNSDDGTKPEIEKKIEDF